MKFMQKSEDKQKEQLKADAEEAINQIRKGKNTFVSAADKFGSKKLDVAPIVE